jgi:hypothetical protein
VPAPAPAQIVGTHSMPDVFEALTELKELFDAGAITQAEFEAKKFNIGAANMRLGYY